ILTISVIPIVLSLQTRKYKVSHWKLKYLEQRTPEIPITKHKEYAAKIFGTLLGWACTCSGAFG
nr:hypothetical protein [Candidatus Freyarchaeota archaeon]